LKNKDKAIKILRSRLYDQERERIMSHQNASRSQQIGTAQRSERIRTYNFSQGRVTDHRCNMTLHNIESMMKGDLLEEFQNAMKIEVQKQGIKELTEE